IGDEAFDQAREGSEDGEDQEDPEDVGAGVEDGDRDGGGAGEEEFGNGARGADGEGEGGEYRDAGDDVEEDMCERGPASGCSGADRCEEGGDDGPDIGADRERGGLIEVDGPGGVCGQGRRDGGTRRLHEY